MENVGRGVEAGLLLVLWQKHPALPAAVGTPERWRHSPAVVRPMSRCSPPGPQVSREDGFGLALSSSAVFFHLCMMKLPTVCHKLYLDLLFVQEKH